MKSATILFVGSAFCIFLGCIKEIEEGVKESDLSKDIEMVTDYGTIIMRLSDETPKHRNNFIRLINEKFYDSIQFHRVIDNFLVQTGNHKTKSSYLQMKKDSVSLPDLIPSEFRPDLFHKRGALNAARIGDDLNPSRSSDGSQFTIIQGKIQTDSALAHSLKRAHRYTALNNIINKPQYIKHFDTLATLTRKIDAVEAYDQELNGEEIQVKTTIAELERKIASFNIDSLADIELETMKKYIYPESHVEIYQTIGGAPHLDQNYTVFGEVINGMNVVDSIAAVPTDEVDKPINDVYILTARMIERKSVY